MAKGENDAALSRLAYVLMAIALVAALYWASEILIPFALAVLISFLLTPLVTRLERIGLGRISAVAITSILAAALIAGLAAMVAGELYNLADSLPRYQYNIDEKVNALRSGNGAFHRLAHVFQEVRRDLSRGAVTQPAPPSATQPESPASSAANPSTLSATPIDLVRAAIKFFFSPLATAGIVAILVVFMLLQREDLRNRFVHLAGQARISITTQAIDEATHRVSRYLLSEFLVNSIYGLVAGLGLYFIGVPSAALWGLLSGLLRFVPYLGIWIAAIGPIFLALAVFSGWTHLLLVAAIYVVLELIVSNFVEPWFYGRRSGISPLAVLLAAVFWTWLWGGVGLLLSTPMTVCLVVLGKYVHQLAFFTALLSDDAALPPHLRLYQVLLGLDPHAASGEIEKDLQHLSLPETFDRLALPALLMLDKEFRLGRIDRDRRDLMRHTFRQALAQLSEKRHLQPPGAPVAPAASKLQTQPDSAPLVLCLPARTGNDQIASVMLAQLLESAGFRAQAAQPASSSTDLLTLAAQTGAGLVCVSATPPATVARARYLVRRLRAQNPDLTILVGIWGSEPGAALDSARIRAAGASGVMTSLTAMVRAIAALLPQSPTALR